MCGIFGASGEIIHIINQHESGARLLSHRGPHNEGIWSDDNVQLELSRLAIIDPSEKANQPFELFSGKILIFNGEIYNFQELKEEWIDKHDNSITKSDTEILYRGLCKEGLNCLKKLNGMFSFAFYDKLQNKIFFARDRTGIKPFYYYHKKHDFIFASEQKAIANYVGWNTNFKRLSEYAVFRHVSGEETLIKDIFELEPGFAGEFDITTGEFKKWNWYELNQTRDEHETNLVQLDDILNNAVKRHLISDAPLGIQLSGGIDSAILSYYVSKNIKSQINSFTIKFPNSKFDESIKSKKIAKKFGFIHHEINFDDEDFVHYWKKSIQFFDEPIHHFHTLPLFKLYEFCKNYVTVVLTGEGADEVFLGYKHHEEILSYKNSKQLRNFGKFLDFKIVKDFFNFEMNSTEEDSFGNKTIFSKKCLKKGEIGISNYEFFTHLKSLLNRIDKMSMANSIEARTPYLDNTVIEFAMKQISQNLIKQDNDGNFNRKIPLKNIYVKNIGELKKSEKIGFHVPYDKWIQSNTVLRNFCAEILDETKKFTELNLDEIKKLKIKLLTNNKLDFNEERVIWVICNYILWKIFPRLKKVDKSDFKFLYELLQNKNKFQNISHKKIPTYDEHVKFIMQEPYTNWYIITSVFGKIGAVYLSKNNEIGLNISKKYDSYFIKKEVFQQIMEKNPREKFFVNINPKNNQMREFLEKFNFSLKIPFNKSKKIFPEDTYESKSE
jgi:asparagine synthase (glutamine-hydrolysing)